MKSVRIGVDIGGTFTDVTVLDELTGRVTIAKVPSRRDDPATALLTAVERGIARAGIVAGDVAMLVHGTTIVTNAVLENKLPKTALLTTEGFRDVLEIGRHFRPDMYDLQQDKPVTVVPRERRHGVKERVGANGEILLRPDPVEVQKVIESVESNGVKAVAICFLNAFANPNNEEMVKTWVRDRIPDVRVCASHEVCREIREFERTSTVVLNAAAMPLVEDYLSQIAPRIRELLPNAKILLMQSSGGSLTIDGARANPARIITSGPAGGALAVQRIGRATGDENLLGVDMGGTSTDISLIHKGELRMTTEGSIAQWPVLLPMIEINTIGAGAGSIAWLDAANGLHVGPHSAGSDPGPVAYGRGGTEPTVTDANLVLGRLHPHRFAEGQLKLDLNMTRQAIEERIGRRLKMSVEEAAAGVLRIANGNMERAIRVSSAEKGYDPRNITLVAFGGAGPMHAAAIASAVGFRTVLVPEQPGVFSAVGLVMSSIRHDFVQTRLLRSDDITSSTLAPLFDELESQAHKALEADGLPLDKRLIQRTADIRYTGQAYAVNVAVPNGKISSASIKATLKEFHERHLRLYAHNDPGKPVELISGRVSAIGLTAAPPIVRRKAESGKAIEIERRPVYFAEAGGFVDTPVYERFSIGPEDVLEGPAIIEQVDTTIVMHKGQSARNDEFGNFVISIGEV